MSNSKRKLNVDTFFLLINIEHPHEDERKGGKKRKLKSMKLRRTRLFMKSLYCFAKSRLKKKGRNEAVKECSVRLNKKSSEESCPGEDVASGTQ